jgi:hypothetical protein
MVRTNLQLSFARDKVQQLVTEQLPLQALPIARTESPLTLVQQGLVQPKL